MPTIYDNIENKLEKGLLTALETSSRADFCVGYFNLRGWKLLSARIDHFDGKESYCRLLIGMQHPEEDLLKQALARMDQGLMDNPTALALKKDIAKSFRKQLTFGVPTAEDEEHLQKLKRQLASGKVVVRLFLGYPLHAKLYLLHRTDKMASLIGYVGSSNLTMSGLASQGELNVDVLEQDAAKKLATWFDDRWNDRWSLDISKELIQVIEESWAGEKTIPPYYIYLKIVYHLSKEARTGISNYIIPGVLRKELLTYQSNAVSIAARHLEKRGGVLIGDVVGLGKTLTATAVAKLFEETFFTDTLIICPKNLTDMWSDYVHRYQLRAKVHSISKINSDFIEKTRRYRVVLIDESHNLRNRSGKKYALVKEYIEKNESKVILLTATPYNKTYADISNQFRLFIPEDKDLGITPEKFIADAGGPLEFIARYQYSPSTLLAFEKSPYSEDWQELLKMYMVRRTRSFIKANYADWDETKQQYYLTFGNGQKSYFPERVPKKIEYSFNENDKTDVYVKLYSQEVVSRINALHLSRYGLGNFIEEAGTKEASTEEKKIIVNLSRAGKRLVGFCRTNLYKRLESSGHSFLVSVSRQLLRNAIFVYAIQNKLPLPIGPQEISLMDEFSEENDDVDREDVSLIPDEARLEDSAKKHYESYRKNEKKFDWIPIELFSGKLLKELKEDSENLAEILSVGKKWNPAQDKKLAALEKLCFTTHPGKKILVFTQFADTAEYLYQQFRKKEMGEVACVTGSAGNPTEFARWFSPVSNKVEHVQKEIRILISTDVLSEGQNLQDCHIVVNYDLPWALIRLIQRAGRVDRIGQESPKIFCYSFLPQEGLERIIQLRNRLLQRITQNAEVVGADEVFFDGDPVNLSDLYNEKSGTLDEDEGEVDLTSQAYEIWNHATKANPELKKKIPLLPDVVYSTKKANEGEGIITYHRNSHDFEILTWLGTNGKIISQSQTKILKAAECALDTPALERLPEHHRIVEKAVELAEKEAAKTGGQLGSQFGARYKVWVILNRYYASVKNTLFDVEPLKRVLDDIHRYTLRETARELVNRRLRMGISEEELASLCIQLREEGKLSVLEQKDNDSVKVPQIICSIGLKAG